MAHKTSNVNCWMVPHLSSNQICQYNVIHISQMNNNLPPSLLIVYSFINCHSSLPIDDKYNTVNHHILLSAAACSRVVLFIKAPSVVTDDADGVIYP